MQEIKQHQTTKKSKFSNLWYKHEEKSSNAYKSTPFLDRFQADFEDTNNCMSNIRLSSLKKTEYFRECYTQTHKKTEDPMSCNIKMGDYNDHAPLTEEGIASLPYDRTFNVMNFLSQEEPKVHNLGVNLLSGSALTKVFLEKNLNKLRRSVTEVKNLGNSIPVLNNYSSKKFKSQSFVDNSIIIDDIDAELDEHEDDERYETKTKKPSSFMSPTIASASKNQSLEIKDIENLLSPSKASRSKRSKSPRLLQNREKDDSFLKSQSDLRMRNSSPNIDIKESIPDPALIQALNKLRDSDWNAALRGLMEIVHICKTSDTDNMLPFMTTINQKLIYLIKSPRSHVSRTACQAAGHIFEFVKDTRRPEFDEIVDSLLCKCADSNKFIRHDANLALDCMVTHIPTFHAVRAICTKGPEHKNPLVRTAAARILVCAIVLAGPQNIIHPCSNEYTKRRIIMKMAGFLEDRSPDVRKYGERIYRMLAKDKIFDAYLSRFLEKDVIGKMKRIMKNSEVE